MSSATARGVASIFDPGRLRIARQAAMVTKKELADRVGVSAGAVSQYENGTTSPSARVVAALALALGMPIGFFATGRDLGEATVVPAHFRSLRATSQQERDRAFAHALLTWELCQLLEQHVRLPALDLPVGLAVRPDDGVAGVEEAARVARRHFDLLSGPVPNVVRLLESRGVICTRLPSNTRRVFAFSCPFPGRPVVVLASERTHRAARRFDAAHELGHLLVHHDEEPGSHAVERQAHSFAAEFLAPAAEISDLLPRRVDWHRLVELKRIWGMSIQALLFRARTLGVMPEHVYRRAVTELSARGWRTEEPGDDGTAEEPVLLSRALEIATAAGTDIELLATAAHLPLDMVRLIAVQDQRPIVEL